MSTKKQQSVPSLYVRVYRPICSYSPYIHSSLTIRDGISGDSGSFTSRISVPSLYVRVYHRVLCIRYADSCSLTIREGISMRTIKESYFRGFPHYTWGYIALSASLSRGARVPSLYVRVYRSIKIFLKLAQRSLTIREGISEEGAIIDLSEVFPHYTWGYIGLIEDYSQTVLVPSLYVRVYRFARIFCRA